MTIEITAAKAAYLTVKTATGQVMPFSLYYAVSEFKSAIARRCAWIGSIFVVDGTQIESELPDNSMIDSDCMKREMESTVYISTEPELCVVVELHGSPRSSGMRFMCNDISVLNQWTKRLNTYADLAEELEHDAAKKLCSVFDG